MRTLLLVSLLAGCGTDPVAPPPASAVPLARADDRAAATGGHADDRTDETAAQRNAAIATAEAFVAAQGYTEAEATAHGAELVRESLDPDDEAALLRRRHGTLQPHAMGAAGSADGWTVAFRYVHPTSAAGRALMLAPGQSPHFAQ